MIWIKRLIVASPFMVAAVLTILINVADRFHWRHEHIAGYGFLFGAPWAWLLDRSWFGSVHPRWLEALIGQCVILWVPAILYSACLWLMLRGIGFVAHRASPIGVPFTGSCWYPCRERVTKAFLSAPSRVRRLYRAGRGLCPEWDQAPGRRLCVRRGLQGGIR